MREGYKLIKRLSYNGKLLAVVCIADTFFSRFAGYMFREEPHHEALLFQPCNSIHTFFMRFNIDVLFLDNNLIIIKKLEDLSKRKMIMPVKGASIVIEAKAGTFKSCEVGSRLSIQGKTT